MPVEAYVLSSCVRVSRYGNIHHTIIADVNSAAMRVSFAPQSDYPIDIRKWYLGLLQGDSLILDDTKTRILGATPSVSTMTPVCPYCHIPIQQIGGSLCCPNPLCRGRQVSRINYFLSPEAFNIRSLQGIRYETWDLILARGDISAVSSLFSPYVLVDVEGLISREQLTEFWVTMSYIKNAAKEFSNRRVHFAMVMSLMQALSIPGITDAVMYKIAQASMEYVPDEHPLSFLAACVQQPDIMLRHGVSPEDVAYMRLNFSSFYVDELRAIAEFILET